MRRHIVLFPLLSEHFLYLFDKYACQAAEAVDANCSGQYSVGIQQYVLFSVIKLVHS